MNVEANRKWHYDHKTHENPHDLNIGLAFKIFYNVHLVLETKKKRTYIIKLIPALNCFHF